MRRRRTAGAACALTLILCVAIAASAGAAGVVTYKTDNRWGSGFQASISVRNDGLTPINNWRLAFDFAPRMSSIWDGQIVSSTSSGYVIGGASWNRDIAPGQTVTFGFVAAPDSGVLPTNCSLNGAPCGQASGPAPTPTTPTPTTTVPTTTTPPPTTTTTPPPSTTTTPATTTSPVTTPAGGITVKVTKVSDWGSGYVADAEISNTSSQAVTNWTLGFDFVPSISSLWSGKLSSSGVHRTVKNESWNGTIPAGGKVTFGFTGDYAGSYAAPTNCVFNGASCVFGSGTAPAPTPTTPTTTTAPTTPTTTTPAPDPTPTPSPGGGNFAFAPYVDMTLPPQFNLTQTARDTGVRYYSLAFIVSQGACNASWGGYYPVSQESQFGSDISSLRGLGGDVVVSFGGAAGTELGQSCTSVSALQAQYQAVIDRYKLTRIDFDIEGGSVADSASVARRNKAIAGLQAQAKATGKRLDVTYTLPALPTALTEDGLSIVRSAVINGVDLAAVNIMAMDYGSWAAPSPQGKMGDYAIQAANSLRDQLHVIYSLKSDAQLWKMVGVTPMLGINDVSTEIFTVDDAKKLTAFANTKHLGMLSMWASNRDKQCTAVSQWTSIYCSGVPQQPFEFSKEFNRYGG